ncbi:MAG: isoleucine--tRNA ligase [Rhodothermaceae bacterium]
MFKQYSDKVKYPEIEERVLKFWKENKVFEKSISTRSDAKPYTFYEGPPTANGKPGIHHVMARTLKDLVCRYKTLQGYQVKRQGGWDTHGLPVEIEVEKQLGIKNKSEIPEFGVAKYNKACRESVFTYKDLWEQMTDRMGYWLDLDTAYVTCTNNYIESVWWALKTMFDKGLIYKDYKIVPQCPRSETVLSSHELALGYKETKDPSVYIKLKVTSEELKSDDGDTFFLVWTTTPWTLLSNVALAVGDEVDYVKIKIDDHYLILAEARLSVITEEYEVVAKYKGADLADKEYEQLFDFCKVDKRGFFLVTGDFVSTEDGSGIVHIAPAFGADDYELSKQFDLPFLQPVKRNGTFVEDIPEIGGKFVKDADPDIIYMLKQKGQLYRKETIVHSYPFSWRFDDVPIIYYARESWFIKTTEIADRMVELNKTINWCPPEVGAGRFGNWLEDNKDWALSRDRYWATPLPIWVSEDGDQHCVGSIEDLKKGYVERDGKRVSVADLPEEEIDLHKPFVDDVKFEINGKEYLRTPELIDVWFDSGAMPFAQLHYPFENKEYFENRYPADFICEGIDQTRGWFYTLHAIGAMLFDNVTYKNVVVNELILDKNGLKMSKSKGNTVNPFDLFDKYGADATRWYLVTTSPPWRPTLFDEEGIVEVQRKFFGTLMNTYSFFTLYANLDNFDFSAEMVPYEKRPEIDRWIISKVSSLVKEYESLMDNYELTKAARAVQDFTIEELSNWYVRRCRRRFWKSEVNENKIAAYQTLYECLEVIAKLTAPFAPFVAEELYQNLNSVTKRNASESVHLVEFPKPLYIDKDLEEKMDIAQKVVYITRSMRAKANLKVRQPLAKIMIAVDKAKRDAVKKMEDVILEEVNIKELVVLEDDAGIVNKSAKPNFKSIGPKYGKIVKVVANAIRELDNDTVVKLEAEGSLPLDIDGENVTITIDDVEIISTEIEGWVVETEEAVTVAIDSELTDELIAEGYSREFVNRVQNMRKDFGLDLMDRISIGFSGDEKLIKSIEMFTDYISNETLATTITSKEMFNGLKQDWKVGEYDCTISIEKAG